MATEDGCIIGALWNAYLGPAKPGSEKWFLKSQRMSSRMQSSIVSEQTRHNIQFQVLCEVFTEPQVCTSVPTNHVGPLNIPTTFPYDRGEAVAVWPVWAKPSHRQAPPWVVILTVCKKGTGDFTLEESRRL